MLIYFKYRYFESLKIAEEVMKNEIEFHLSVNYVIKLQINMKFYKFRIHF